MRSDNRPAGCGTTSVSERASGGVLGHSGMAMWPIERFAVSTERKLVALVVRLIIEVIGDGVHTGLRVCAVLLAQLFV
ncbi:hypothetical protein SAMN05444365_102274 [Micromonospora pattaloongensis]|uniref:Uncharacterized protein n=1 Tax=Micromonospora pattaloongensis TaxID=405436 RepID=A0A1H3JWG6_9ACTN|nr:hypothetical protein SAMN05444365_102274 [Micromonospora pattaloongensis]